MRPVVRRVVPAWLAALMCFTLLFWPAAPAGATTARHPMAALPARLTHVYGYLMDAHPNSDSVLQVYSKAHHRTYAVAITGATIVKRQGRIVPRSALQKGQYVIASCTRRSDGTLEAVRVSIVVRHKRQRKH